MKKLLSCLLLLSTLAVQAQVYNNEWIDHSKTYFKFKVGKTGMYRIPQATLAAAGLADAPAEHFQLWRNGVEVPIYTSAATGTLATTDFIEFWGLMNDGKPDKALYRDPSYQLNDKWSLQTDTAAYFLTINPAGNNKRLVPTANNVAGNTLPAEPYFMHTVGNYFKNRLNGGYAINVGQNLFSSSYDKGEGYTSAEITTGNSNNATFSNLFVATGGPDVKFKISVSGNALYPRYARVRVNNDSVLRFPFDFYNLATDSTTFPVSKIATNSAAIQVTNICNLDSCVTIDRMVIHQYEMTYPRLFNFGNATSFEFSLPASAAGNYLEIKGFNNASTVPILYDLTNGKRYLGNIATAGTVKIVLEPSATPRQLVLVGQQTANINLVNTLQSRQFINYADINNQADYLIISNQRLFTNTDGSNPVEEYRAYRSSNTGGAFNAKVFDVDELVDQFGFGIKKHPLAVRNFVLFARRNFADKPKHLFIIGKGVNYSAYRTNESKAEIELLNLVPTFGVPASDALLTADPGSSVPQLSYGRLSAINEAEVATYLKKVKETELGQAALSPNRQDKEWMKNVMHINGISDADLRDDFDGYYNKYKSIISDTLFGANVVTFSKTNPDAVEQITSAIVPKLFKDGLSLISYFGHSSATTLDFNLESPESYQNQGKYPFFIALGCYVGDFFNFNTRRFVEKETIPEKYVLAQDRGTIGFIASTHYGIVHYLDIWNTELYKAISRTHYGRSIGEMIIAAAKTTFEITSQEDFYSRSNIEQMELNGDPAVKINPHAKPDYVIEESMVKVSPDFISVAETSVKVTVSMVNIGKAISDSIIVEAKRQYPSQISEIVFKKTISGIRYKDSISFHLPIDALRDKGINKLTITVDSEDNVDESFETNNSITKEFVVYEDEIRPVYPYNYAIVNKPSIKLIASTANAFSSIKEYKLEIDTTIKFNSPLKVTETVNSSGGAIEFEPEISFTNNTVYYWRVAQASFDEEMKWKSSSFIYLNNNEPGFNQSHQYQHLNSNSERIELDTISRVWNYKNIVNNLFIKQGVWGTATGQTGDVVLNVNDSSYIRGICGLGVIVYNLFDPITFKPVYNAKEGTPGRFESASPCNSQRVYNFEYSINDTPGRRRAMDFLKSVNNDYIVVVRIHPRNQENLNHYVNTWKLDENIYGNGNTLYHELLRNRVYKIDSFYKARAFISVFQKGNPDFDVKYSMSEGLYDLISLSVNKETPDSLGIISSPVFGPAKEWKTLSWSGESIEPTGDNARINIYGIKNDGSEVLLHANIKSALNSFDLSAISASDFPNLRLQMINADTLNFTPYQLKYWRLSYSPVPEGALAPNIFLQMKDTVETGEPLEFKVAFKNVSETAFDSVKVKLVVIDRNNVSHVLQNFYYKPLLPNDTLTVIQAFDTKKFVGLNSLFIDINPENNQPEQYHFNNFGYRNFLVIQDTLNPLMDITFDNIHILNNDIVSPKPDIVIKLKDDAKWNLLNDTSLVTIKVKYPNGVIKPFYFNSDTLRFNSATGNENEATINFKPHFDLDGTYELMVAGKDKSENKAGLLDYKIVFEVYNKSMISNLLNYPNPFTSSTAFVFTLTGASVPQEFKIQILTVTGKVVKEITRQELGFLKIGRNITEYKWDGTDQYGQKLANGVYLYRVVTSLEGKSLEKFKSKNESENTDKYFNKGYGKMYLMR